MSQTKILKTVFLISLIFCVILMGCVRDKKLDITEEQISEAKKQAIAIGATSISKCNELTNDPAKDNCFLYLAVYERDPSICLMMPQGKFSGLRYRDCYEAVGMEMKDVAICEDLDDAQLARACYHGVAVGTLDVSLCEKGSHKEDCYLKVGVGKSDLSVCDKIESSKKWTCYMSIGINTQDSSICDRIEDDFKKEACHNTIKLAET